MYKIICFALTLLVGYTINSSSVLFASDSPAVVGTWQLKKYSQMFLDTKQTVEPFGDHPTGYIQYSPGGHLVVFITAGEIPSPASDIYNDTDRSNIYKKFIGAYAGTYSVEGNKVIHHVLTAWRPEWIGHDQMRYFETDGKTLTLKTQPIKWNLTGQDMISSLTFERVE